MKVGSSGMAPIYATLFVLAGGCAEGLDPPSIVVGPRILAVSVDPPEAQPGQAITLRVLGVDPTRVPQSLSFRWYVCFDADETVRRLGGSPSGTSECRQSIDINGTTLPLVIENGASATIPEVVTTALGSDEYLNQVAAGIGFNPDIIRQVLNTSGIPFSIIVDMQDASTDPPTQLVRAFKRLAVTTRLNPTTNPPLEALQLALSAGEQRLGLIVPTAEEGRCAFVPQSASEPVPLRLPPNTVVTFEPQVTTGWLESYPVWNYTGQIETREEGAYFTWFSTGGAWSLATTQDPDFEVNWRTPVDVTRPAEVFWVVRDGHLGARPCRLEVTIAE